MKPKFCPLTLRHLSETMEAPGYFLYLPPTALKARFVMIEESSKIMFDVDLKTPKLGNPMTWASGGIIPANTGSKLAIIIPNPFDAEQKQTIAASGGNPNFGVGQLVSVKRQKNKIIYGKIIGRVNICPFDDSIMSWDKLKEYKGKVMHDEVKNGLLARVYGGKDVNRDSVHADILARMPRRWHEDAEVLNAELDGMFASGDQIEKGELKWWLSEGDEDSDEDES